MLGTDDGGGCLTKMVVVGVTCGGGCLVLVPFMTFLVITNCLIPIVPLFLFFHLFVFLIVLRKHYPSEIMKCYHR